MFVEGRSISTKRLRRNADRSRALGPNQERWLGAESNRRHEDFQSSALPTELPSRLFEEGRIRCMELLRVASGFVAAGPLRFRHPTVAPPKPKPPSPGSGTP